MIPVFFSCEHATCAVPEPWRELFRGHEEAVASEEGWEPGALNLAQGFAIRFRTPLSHGDVTRLLIDLEAAGDDQWSRLSAGLTEVQKGKLRERHARPFLESMHHKIGEALRRDPRVVHVMVHVEALEEGVVRVESPPGDGMAAGHAEEWVRAMLKGPDAMPAVAATMSKISATGRSLHEAYGAERVSLLCLRVSRSYFLEGRPWRWEKAKKRLIDSLAAALAALTPAPECSLSGEDPGCAGIPNRPPEVG